MAMADTRLQWGAEALWEQLHSLLPGLSVEIAASLPSTNSTLLERARVGSAVSDPTAGPTPAAVRRSVESSAFGRRAADWQPCLLVAEEQTAGRGRMGRDWYSEPLASLTFSLAIPLAPRDWSGLSLAIGVMLANALDPPTAGGKQRIGIKWPNDLWLIDPAGHAGVGRKLGGILIETVSSGSKRLAVIGIGLNVTKPSPVHTIPGSSGFACVSEIEPSLDAPQALARVALPLVEGLLVFEKAGYAAFAERFAARDLLLDRPVVTTRDDVPHGTARGVAADGSLFVDTDSGRIQLHSGEVSVRPRPRPTPAGPAC
ncbi:biotin--[acetyl-CoA-carboxylase] ligase [Piscinibacter sakaiensis]|uniref:biotin--[acetyl-CoA-carboxylase] ligase n=1 Tax=Piscinibacter sakaiensis TaxID=1547922 RepID=UPI003AAC17D7